MNWNSKYIYNFIFYFSKLLYLKEFCYKDAVRVEKYNINREMNPDDEIDELIQTIDYLKSLNDRQKYELKNMKKDNYRKDKEINLLKNELDNLLDEQNNNISRENIDFNNKKNINYKRIKIDANKNREDNSS